MWQAIAGLFAFLLAVLAWLKDRQRESVRRKQEIKDNVESGDVSRIHATIDRLRRK